MMNDMGKSPCFGWILKENPFFWENQGFIKKVNPIYYGCKMAEVNHHPVYEKTGYFDRDCEEQAAVEVFSCDCGVIQNDYMVFLFEWNNAGGSKYPMIAAKQVCSINQYNEFIKEYGFDQLEDDESFLINLDESNINVK